VATKTVYGDDDDDDDDDASAPIFETKTDAVQQWPPRMRLVWFLQAREGSILAPIHA